jgi:hypothetical protein
MANLTSVTLTAGVPTAGTGTVGTIDNVTGTAGTPSTAVLTVQGVASGTNINTSTQVTSKTTNPVGRADGTIGAAIADKVGKLVSVQSIRDLKGRQVTTITSSTAETTVVTATAATFNDVYGVIVENTSATGTEIVFKDSTAGSTAFTLYVPANDTRGFTIGESGALKQTTVNNNWTATCTTSVASVVITMLYVQNI